MLPVKLKLQGVNSYQKEQIIEFDKLLESKIFGIFGEVGSGKSTILEAISYVLYGKYDKLKGEKVSYNLMNLKSDRFMIDFEFVVENNKNYRFVVEGKRNSKKFEDVKVTRSYYVREENRWLPKEKLDAKELIGLSFENFNRTIIIPQGRFMEFINLSGTERTKMLKEIFNLYKYDLFDKVSNLQKKNNIDLANLEGILSRLEDVNEEIIAENKELLKNILAKRRLKDKELKIKKEEFDILEKIKIDFLRLDELNEKYEKLLKDKPEIEKSEKKIKEYELCIIEFKADIDRLEELEKDISQLESKKTITHNDIINLENQLQKVKTKFERLSRENAKLDTYKKQKTDYEIILEIKKVENDIGKTDKYLNETKKELAGIEKIYKARKKKISDIKNKISNKEKQMPDIALLSEIKNWFSQVSTMQNSIVEIINSITGKKMSLQKLKKSVPVVFENEDIKVLKVDTSLGFDDLILQLESVINHWKQGLKELQKERDEVLLKDKLKEFAHSLEDGKPCPVCGALEHPNPIRVEGLNEEINKINARIENGEALVDKARKYLDKLKELRTKIENEETNIEEESAKLDDKKKQLDDFMKSFKWDGFSNDDPEKVEIAFRNAKELKEDLDELKGKSDKMEKEALDDEFKLDSINAKKVELNNDLSALKAKRETLSGQLKEFDFEDFNEVSSDIIEKNKKELGEKILNIASGYEKAVQDKNNMEIKLAETKTVLENIIENLNEKENIRVKIMEGLDNKIETLGYRDLSGIKEILKQNLDVEKIKEKINSFRLNLQSVQKEIETLQAKLKDNTFDEARYTEIKNEIDKIKNEIEIFIGEKSRLENLIKDQESKLKEKEGFLKEKEEKEIRRADLELLKSLFKANGFVNYISTVRLREVVNYANSRFMKLTRGKMKIELNNDNSFDVVDFLNNGERRSIKSLSGGQTFQASLSLALAMASIVQQQNKSNQNFFFLDEGFGTQDDESLRLVFDTIKSLRKENRIVGLISHVSRLKEEVNTYLEVKNDEQKGSIITKSWEKTGV